MTHRLSSTFHMALPLGYILSDCLLIGVLSVLVALATSCGVSVASQIKRAAGAPPVSISISPMTATLRSSGVQQFTAVVQGSNSPVSWSANAGSISNGGLFTAPSVTSRVAVSVNASAGNAQAAALVTVNPNVPLSVTTSTLPAGTAGALYSASLSAIGGQPPYSWNVIGSLLPQGIQLVGSTGVLSGTTFQTGSFQLTVKVTDSDSATSAQNLTLVVVNSGPTYTARTDHNIQQNADPIPNMGGLTGTGTCVVPSDFNFPVCRITDANLDPSLANQTRITTTSGSGDTSLWNTNSSLLMLQGSGARTYPMAFNPVSMQASRLYPLSSPTTGGFYLGKGATAWSYANPMLLYRQRGTTILSYDFSGYDAGGNPPTPSTVFDFAAGSAGPSGTTSDNCLPSGYIETWSSFGEISKAPADQVFLSTFSNNGTQGTGGDVVAYKVGSGCTHLNTLTGTVTGDWGATGTVSIPDRIHVHNVKISKDGQWAIVAQTGCLVSPTILSISRISNVVTAVMTNVSELSVGMAVDATKVATGANGTSFNLKNVVLTAVDPATNTLQWAQADADDSSSGGQVDNCISSGPYFWQIGTANFYQSCLPGTAAASGGACGGHWTEGFSHFVNANYSPFWQQIVRPFGKDPVGEKIIPGLPLARGDCIASAVDQHQNWSNDDPNDTNPFFSTTTNAPNPSLQPEGGFTCAWVNEVLGISPSTGTVYRFAHTRNTGLSWNFSTRNAIGGVSQDGRFFIFSSDWEGTLGSESGGTTCIPSKDCRGDVFVVGLIGIAPSSPRH